MRRVLFALVLAAATPMAAAFAEPPDTHEILVNRPSGFWTSNRPAIGGAYRYRLLAIGVVIASITAYLVWRAIRRANEQRARRVSGNE